DRSPERPQELGRVEQQAEHALLARHPELTQGIAGPVHQRREFRVGEGAAVVVEGGVPAPALRHVPIYEEGSGVEAVGDRERCHRHQRRFPDRPVRPAPRDLAAGRALERARGRAGAGAGCAGFTAMASISTSSSGWTSRDTTRRVFGGYTPSGKYPGNTSRRARMKESMSDA